MTAILGYSNRFFGESSFSGGLESSPPASNLGIEQLPIFAQFDGAAVTIDCEAMDGSLADEFSADTFAILGLQGFPDGAEVEFLDGSVSLGVVTYSEPPIGGRHAVLTLSAPVTLDTLTVSITGAGTGIKKVGAVWASTSYQYSAGLDFDLTTSDTSIVSASEGGTVWAYSGDAVQNVPIRGRTDDPETVARVMRSIGAATPVLLILDRNGSRYAVVYGYVEPGWSIRPVNQYQFDFSARINETI